jgi:hypothetical protein
MQRLLCFELSLYMDEHALLDENNEVKYKWSTSNN